MKWLINDKGMMFGGRINIIDFIVLLVFLICLPMFYFGWKIFNRPPPPPQPQTIMQIEISEYKQLKQKETQIQQFLTEYKRARRYFK